MEKDLRYARGAGAQLGVELSMSAAPESLFRKAQEQGCGEKDMSAVVEAVRAEGPDAAADHVSDKTWGFNDGN
jgi:3-hydroxyisobutyrate dehydrogenase